MKDRHEMISQDIIKIQGNGLFVSLVKGQGSKVKYRNVENGDIITLSYNPKAAGIPTVAQKPDNVLSLRKRSGFKQNRQYEYVFDAKYRMNPALPGTDYYKEIFQGPGPEVDDARSSKGSGLGLAIVRELVLMQGGKIFVEPRKKGSCFVMEFPILEN